MVVVVVGVETKEGHLTQSWEFRESFPEEVKSELNPE